jgi:hypothetical protein
MSMQSVMAVATAFIVLGVLQYVPGVAVGLQWIIAGVVALLVGKFAPQMMGK